MNMLSVTLSLMSVRFRILTMINVKDVNVKMLCNPRVTDNKVLSNLILSYYDYDYGYDGYGRVMEGLTLAAVEPTEGLRPAG